MRTEKNLFPRVADFNNLHRAFLAASQGKRDRPEVYEFEYHLETRLWEIRAELETATYHWGPFRRFFIRDPKYREIRAAPFRDRVVHHAIFNILDPIFRRGFIADSYACIPGKGTHPAVERYRHFIRARGGRGYRLQCDIKSYFASVDHEVMLKLLAHRIGDARMLALLRSLVLHGADTPGRGMPIGNLTSQLFANVYLDALDHFVKEAMRVRHYLRYMDDFLLLAGDGGEARRQLTAVKTFLAAHLRLQLNPRRVVIAPLCDPCDLLGYVEHARGCSRVRRRSVLRLWRRLPALERRLAAEKITYNEARASVSSWFGLAKHANAFHLSRSVFETRDVRNIGKRLMVQQAAPRNDRHGGRRAQPASVADLVSQPAEGGGSCPA